VWTPNTIVSTPPTADSVYAEFRSGQSQSFAFKYSSVNGIGYLTSVYGIINSGLSGTGACFYQYYAPASTLYLYNDAGTAAAGTLTPGAVGSVQQ